MNYHFSEFSMRRRTFLRGLAAAGVGLPLLGPFGPVRTFAHSAGAAPFRRLVTGNPDRVFVIIRLYGGNDGLNTLVPYHDERYYRARKHGTASSVAISPERVLPLPDSGTLGFHPAFAPMHELYSEGKVAIVQNIGYPAPNLSHFRSTDIWLSGSDSEVVDRSGWYAKYLESQYPDYPALLPSDPYGIEFDNMLGVALTGRRSNMGISLGSVSYIPGPADVVDDGSFAAAIEAEYVHEIARQSNIFLSSIAAAFERRQSNMVEYPTEYPTAVSLSAVARLIAAGMTTQLYLINLDGFDTHYGQLPQHERMLEHVARSIHAFQRDLELLGLDDRVCLMTISEFGRRVESFGLGTDHGAAAPLFVVGSGVRGGIIGHDPDLDDLDESGNLKMEFDFRQVYASVLGDWFGADESDISSVALPRRFERLPIFRAEAPSDIVVSADMAAPIRLGLPTPNPASTYAVVPIDGLTDGTDAMLTLSSSDGTILRRWSLVPSQKVVRIDLDGIPGGVYFYTLRAGRFRETNRLVVER